MKLKILFEDKNLMVIDKPAGIAVHADARTTKKDVTIADLVLEYDKKLLKVGEPMTIEYKGEEIKIKRPGIVHRLDKETSGVLLVAKNQKTFLMLKEQFQNHSIKKNYKAFVYGYVSDPKASLLSGKRGVINAPIGRSPVDIRMWTAGRGAREPVREAVTEYIVLDKFVIGEHKFSYIEAYPKTGRTHQIRVHMRYINHPIVSDPLYRGSNEMALGMKRLALHAHFITFRMPNGELKTIESSLPADFKKVIKTYLEK
ncbi:MAG: RluA family pseudouridine synthase [Candidatus Paceibacterota bacterium]|jgi:23S rRNA pseudouridine1911/1915/1917 synthase